MRRVPFSVILVIYAFAATASRAADRQDSAGPDAIFEKPAPIAMADLNAGKLDGVCAVEVRDYAYPGYRGKFAPSPPHADLNPQKAIIVAWARHPSRFVFQHEASYCPWMQMPNGLSLVNQFFEGNDGWAELFNDLGRRERNSFVDIIQSGPERAWVRWNYFCVNKDDDSHPALRGTEDFIAYPNGLLWRRMTYQTMMPEKHVGYSWQPIDFFAIIPPGVAWMSLVQQDPQHGDFHVAAVLDAASDKRYDVYWARPDYPKPILGCGKPRRSGDNKLLQEIARSPLGFAMIFPSRGGLMPFLVFGDASGFSREKSQIVDHSHNDTGGFGWGAFEIDHWPVGWTNSQCSIRQPGSPYPYHICPMSHFTVAPPLRTAADYPARSRDMNLNRWSERHVYYALHGVGRDFESIRRIARQWLSKRSMCARPESIADLTP